MKNRIKTILACFGVLALVGVLTAGFTGFDIIRLAGGIIQDSGGNTRIIVSPTDTNVTLTGTVDFSSTVNKTSQPCFLVYLSASASNATGSGEIVSLAFNTEAFDQGDDFASSSFTASVDGRYFFTTYAELEELSTANHSVATISLVTSNQTYNNQMNDIPTSLVRAGMLITTLADMDANDTAYVRVQVEGSSTVVDILGTSATFTRFSGSLFN